MNLRGLVGSFAALVLALVVAAGIGLATTTATENPNPVASLKELREAGVLLLEEQEIYLVYNGGRPLALSTDAGYAGDKVVFCESSGLFESKLHGFKFDSRGFYYGGSAPRGLARYPIRIERDSIHIDIRSPIEGPARGEGPPHPPRGAFCPTSI